MISTIILAAGRGSRMRPLTESIPKPLAKVNNKTLLEYNLEPLVDISDEFIIVISWLGDQIQEYIGQSFQGVPVKYITQENPKGGTLDAFRTGISAANTASTGFIAANSDNILGPKLYTAFEGAIKTDRNKVIALAHTVEDKEKLKTLGVFETSQSGDFIAIHEKPQEFISTAANVGIYYFPIGATNKIEEIQTQPEQPEEYIIDLITVAKSEPGVKIISENDTFIAISTVQDLNIQP